MALKMNLQIGISQNLVMTPAMQQAIKILQFNQMQMAEYLEDQMLSNPLLEKSTGDGDDTWDMPDGEGLNKSLTEDSPGAESGAGDDVLDGGDVGDAVGSEDFFEAADNVDSSMDNNFDIGYGDRLANIRPDGAYDEDSTPWEERTSSKESLHELLSRQIKFTFTEQRDRMAAAHLCGYLSDAGWLEIEMETVCEEIGLEEAHCEWIIKSMQQFEPSGIFARNLAECMSIQLEQRGKLSEEMELLLKHLPLIAEGKFKKLMKICGCAPEELKELLDTLRRLDPKPAAAFDLKPSQHVTPDVFCYKDPDGIWIVELNNENLPNILVDRHYYTQALAGSHAKIEKEYLTQQYQNAQWLIKALNQRATTILKVAAAVVNHQYRFLEYGVSALEPLVLQEIADQIEMHASTISRATQDKYISTPRGVFEMKYFFQTGIDSNNPNVRFSAEAIRHRIKAIIAEEKAEKAISDDAISEILSAEGIILARRTIAKYREEMNIPSSSKRKRKYMSEFSL